MKKTGILNAELSGELTKLRHLDCLVICDAGFPIPKGAQIVDISLIAGIPTFLQTLKAVLNELIFEEYYIFDFMEAANKEYFDTTTSLLAALKSNPISMDEFRSLSSHAKLFIRTGELRPASNILLVSASGVAGFCEQFNVICDMV